MVALGRWRQEGQKLKIKPREANASVSVSSRPALSTEEFQDSQGYGQNPYLKKPTREKKKNRVGEKEREGKKEGRTDGQTGGRTDWQGYLSLYIYISQHIQSPSSIPNTTRKEVLICNSKLHSRATMVSELLCVTLFIKLTKFKNTQWAAMLNWMMSS